jgi:H+-transporting ATPase
LSEPEQKGSDETLHSEDGLSSSEASNRLTKFGYNEVPAKKTSFLLEVAKKFWGITPWMLEITIAFTWLLGRYADTYIVSGLLVFNAALSIFEEKRANAAVEFLKQKLSIQAKVKRDGKWISRPARELVVGDAIRLRAGDVVPADVKVARGSAEVDQSALTGESLSVSKKEEDTINSGSILTRGEVSGTVTATGTRTYFGRTVELVQLAKPKLHMEEVTANVVRWLIAVVVVLLGTAIAVSVIRHVDLTQIVPLAVVLLVSAIPVALPAMFSISMALGSMELAKKGVLVTRLSASEDAATMDVLCADKTGTLTKNKLVVSETVAYNSFSDSDVVLFGSLASNEANQDPIDLAFLNSAKERGLQMSPYMQNEFYPFDPSTRMTKALITSEKGKFYAAKGAVSAISDLCKLEDSKREEINQSLKKFTKKGYRVLAVARGETEDNFVLAGLSALADELREDSPKLVQELRALGISVKMLTGDAFLVAREVAQKLSLGPQVEKMSEFRQSKDENEFAQIVEESSGIAEIYPEDKYKIVKGLQRMKHVVGMTGDGINDAAALKQAEVGIAVRSATDVAKGAASAVLTVDGLEPIVEMVKTGRMVYQRVVTWVINKIVKTFQVVVFVVLAFLVTGNFVVSLFSMVLYLFLTDFVTLSISTDTVRFSQKPDTWNIGWLVRLGVLMGTLTVAESFAALYVGMNIFGLTGDLERLHMLIFAYLVFSGLFNVFILRERKHFWHSRPSKPLLTAIIADVALVSGISLFGFYNLLPITLAELTFVLGWALVSSLILNDPIKVKLVERLTTQKLNANSTGMKDPGVTTEPLVRQDFCSSSQERNEFGKKL